jgi:hypothetical protein
MNPTFTAKWRGVALMDKMRVNQEIIRAREILAELKLNNQKAHELVHTARNLITIRRLMLEEVHWHRHRKLTNH